MAELRWRLALYRRLIGAQVRAQLQYRLSFGLDLIGAFFISFIDFLVIVVIFTHLPRLAGWPLLDVAFFYAIANLSFACCDLFIGHLDLFPRTIKEGTFDVLLVRPAGSLFQVIASDLALRRLGRAAQGLIILLVVVARLSVPWTPVRIGMLLMMVPVGTAIYAGVWILGVTVSFWTTEIQEITNAFTYGGSVMASYPINIFEGWVRRLFAFVIPMAFVSYFPGLYVLDRPDPLGAPVWLQFCPPLVAVIVVLVAGRMWQVGVRHYRSTGS